MGFVKFTEVGKNFTPKVSINPRGMLCFNQGAKRKFGMDQYTHGVLYFDPERTTIGFEMTNNDAAEGAHKLRIKDSGVEINARGFLTFFEIEPQQTQTFGLVQGKDSTFLVIDLTEGQQTVKADEGGQDDVDLDIDDDSDLEADLVAAMDDDDDVVVVPVNVHRAREDAPKLVANGHINGGHKPVPQTRRSVKSLIGELLSD
jgi:hypothetical protein